jgi:hypothetical protein
MGNIKEVVKTQKFQRGRRCDIRLFTGQRCDIWEKSRKRSNGAPPTEHQLLTKTGATLGFNYINQVVIGNNRHFVSH